LLSCTKYRTVPTPSGTGNKQIQFGTLRVNEFVCKGVSADAQTYFGTDAKWFEIYNTASFPIELTPGQWAISDSLGAPGKFIIPSDSQGHPWSIPAQGYLAVLCMKSSNIPSAKRINATFSLNSTEGDIGIYYKENLSSDWTAIDTLSYSFPAGAISGISYGRLPDGEGPIVELTQVTPEKKNQ